MYLNKDIMNTRKVNLHDLYEIKRKKEVKHTGAYNHILDICYNKIKKVAEHGGMCLYHKVPPVVIGYPLYDYHACMTYIMKELKKSGLYITILPEPNHNYIYISWKLQDISPKAKSMLLIE